MATNTHAGTEVPSGSHGGSQFPAFDTTTYPGQILWLIITFGLLYMAMSRLIIPRIRSILDDRQTTLSRDLSRAHQARTDAEEAGKAYETSLAEARRNAQSLAQSAHAKISAESEARRKALEEELAGRMNDANETIAKTKAKAMKNVRSIAADTTSALVERVIDRTPTSDAIEAALNEIKV